MIIFSTSVYSTKKYISSSVHQRSLPNRSWYYYFFLSFVKILFVRKRVGKERCFFFFLLFSSRLYHWGTYEIWMFCHPSSWSKMLLLNLHFFNPFFFWLGKRGNTRNLSQQIIVSNWFFFLFGDLYHTGLWWLSKPATFS